MRQIPGLAHLNFETDRRARAFFETLPAEDTDLGRPENCERMRHGHGERRAPQATRSPFAAEHR